VGLFEQNEEVGARRQEAAATQLSSFTAEQAEMLWSQVTNREPLPDTLDALKRLPEAIRIQAEEVAKGMFHDEFIMLARARASSLERSREAGSSLNVMAHSAKLAVFSAVGHLAASPWHLADSALLRSIGNAMRDAKNFDAALARFRSLQCMNLFVAALETDDRDSYLKSVKSLVRRNKVHNLVLDGELIEWRPEAEFLAACTEIGIRPMYVGIADRKAASSHSMLRPELTPQRIPALYVDTQGRQLELTDAGEVKLPEPGPQEPISSPEAAPAGRASVVRGASAPDTSAGAAPTSAMQSRIQALRTQQARRAARP
jgi:hypothetical protein